LGPSPPPPSAGGPTSRAGPLLLFPLYVSLGPTPSFVPSPFLFGPLTGRTRSLPLPFPSLSLSSTGGSCLHQLPLAGFVPDPATTSRAAHHKASPTSASPAFFTPAPARLGTPHVTRRLFPSRAHVLCAATKLTKPRTLDLPRYCTSARVAAINCFMVSSGAPRSFSPWFCLWPRLFALVGARCWPPQPLLTPVPTSLCRPCAPSQAAHFLVCCSAQLAQAGGLEPRLWMAPPCAGAYQRSAQPSHLGHRISIRQCRPNLGLVTALILS
jgi:hypothetical protein